MGLKKEQHFCQETILEHIPPVVNVSVACGLPAYDKAGEIWVCPFHLKEIQEAEKCTK